MYVKFEGIVLFRRKYREHDGLVKVFTQEYGTKMFFVKGLYKSNYRYNSLLLPLNWNRFIGRINEEGLSFIQEIENIDNYSQLQIDLFKQAYASYLLQLFDAALADNQVNTESYQLLKLLLEKMKSSDKPGILSIYAEIHLLNTFGVGSNFNHCASCQRERLPFVFSLRLNSVLCIQHQALDPNHLKTSSRALYIANIFAKTPLTLINSVQLSSELEEELHNLMDEIYAEYVGIHLKSKSYLRQILKLK